MLTETLETNASNACSAAGLCLLVRKEGGKKVQTQTQPSSCLLAGKISLIDRVPPSRRFVGASITSQR